ncbi:MAG: hypothetical protein ACFFG0_48455 [Candidatus Thorarchaeota archaeon]
MIRGIFHKLTFNYFKKEEKQEPPYLYGIIKLTDIAKQKGVYDEENLIIELHMGNKIDIIKFTRSDVDALREQGIPVVQEEYGDDYEFEEGPSLEGIEYRR